MKINVHTFYTRQISLPFSAPIKKQLAPIKGELGRSLQIGNEILTPPLKLTPFVTSHFLNSWQLLMVIGQFVFLQPSSFLNMPSFKTDIALFPTLNKSASLGSMSAHLEKSPSPKSTKLTDLLSDFTSQRMAQNSSLEQQIPASSLSSMKAPGMNGATAHSTQEVISTAEGSFHKTGGGGGSSPSKTGTSLRIGGSLETEHSTVSSFVSSMEILLSSASLRHSKQILDSEIGLPQKPSSITQSKEDTELPRPSEVSNTSLGESNPMLVIWRKWCDFQKSRGVVIPEELVEWKKPQSFKHRKAFIPWVIQHYEDGDTISSTPCEDAFCMVNGLGVEDMPNDDKLMILLSRLLKQGLITENDILSATNLHPYEIRGLWDIPDDAVPQFTRLRGSSTTPEGDDPLRL